jgi:dTMP kinase
VILALDGPDGAGKSTQVRGLLEWANTAGYTATVVGKWDVFRPGMVRQARFLRGTDLVELRTCIAEMPSPSRMLFLGWLNTAAATRAQHSDADLVILDGYWAKHAAAELLAGCPPRLVNAITAAIAPADVIVYLDVTPEEALRRKGTDLAPYECGRDPGCSPAHFLAHQAAVRKVLLDWARCYEWTIINTESLSQSIVQQRLRECVRERIRAVVSPPHRPHRDRGPVTGGPARTHDRGERRRPHLNPGQLP